MGDDTTRFRYESIKLDCRFSSDLRSHLQECSNSVVHSRPFGILFRRIRGLTIAYSRLNTSFRLRYDVFVLGLRKKQQLVRQLK